MKKTLIAFLLIGLTSLNLLAKGDLLQEGVEDGKWTMDLEAAKAYAKKTGKPLLLNFTGSDWCHWCIKMEEQVFAKAKWSAFAKDNLVQVFIDFPQDKSLVPEKYVARNQQLQQVYGVKGYPTYILLDGKSGEKLGQLGASKDATAEKFILQVKELSRYTAQNLEKLVASLSGDEKERLKSLADSLSKNEAALVQLDLDYTKKKVALESKLRTAKNEIRSFQEFSRLKAEGYSDERAKAYLKILDKQAKVQAELAAWLAKKPARNEENMKAFEAFNSTLKELASELESFSK